LAGFVKHRGKEKTKKKRKSRFIIFLYRYADVKKNAARNENFYREYTSAGTKAGCKNRLPNPWLGVTYRIFKPIFEKSALNGQGFGN